MLHTFGLFWSKSGTDVGGLYDNISTATYNDKLPILGVLSGANTIYFTVPIAPLYSPHVGSILYPCMHTLAPTQRYVRKGIDDSP